MLRTLALATKKVIAAQFRCMDRGYWYHRGEDEEDLASFESVPEVSAKLNHKLT